ncbi:hypothetical protein R6Z07F_003901 [Ovis aries]
MHWRRKWQLTPVLLPGKSHGRKSLVGYSPWGHRESDTTEQLRFHFSFTAVSVLSTFPGGHVSDTGLPSPPPFQSCTADMVAQGSVNYQAFHTPSLLKGQPHSGRLSWTRGGGRDWSSWAGSDQSRLLLFHPLPWSSPAGVEASRPQEQ